MKHTILVFLGSCAAAWAGEAALVQTYQPLDGQGSGEIEIRPVSCVDWYSHSGFPNVINLISAPNKPPTNAPEPVGDINLASIYGLSFKGGDPEGDRTILLDATRFAVPENHGHPREKILRASLECLRKVLPEKFTSAPIKLECHEKDREWIGKILEEFKKHDRSKPFFESPR
ncbi:hypothetical protein KBB96_11080 [Luteolibacter ambystomatis]|uniref:Uncharacterized protein n=1 Tax=Luteolibacter ambystomatis TaxID=2824561 RepID=A0A975G5X2_9BACT|nr:hypothetical protein [Luteolibacter ambystomatis]QUE49415.1 hypothetical protein KBB96_11080 [Luteolibacter ambystomatis]